MTTINVSQKEEWLRVLGKGMVTIPKKWREEMGLEEGKMIKARKTASGIIIEPLEKPVSYRVYSQKELIEFVKDDSI